MRWYNQIRAIVITLALVQFVAFGMLVGRARGLYGIKAPATTGHEMFERYFRVHYNTMELLIVFVPAGWLFGLYVIPGWGAANRGSWLDEAVSVATRGPSQTSIPRRFRSSVLFHTAALFDSRIQIPISPESVMAFPTTRAPPVSSISTPLRRLPWM